MSEANRSGLPPLTHGTVVNDRYEIRQSLGKGGMGEVFLAYDRTTQQPVALKIVREESRMPGDDEALRQELLLARSVEPPQRVPRARPRAQPVRAHPRDGVHHRADAPHAHPSEEGPGRLHGRRVPAHRARRRVGRRGHPRAGARPRRPQARQRHGHDQRRRLASARPSSSTSASPRSARAPRARRPGAPPDGGTPELHEPRAHPLRRRQPGGRRLRPRPHALEMWTCRVPEPGYKPRAKTMRAADHVRRPVGAVSIDEIKQVFRCLVGRPAAAPARAAPALLQPRHADDEPHPGPARAARPGPAARAERVAGVRARARRRSSRRSRRTRPSSWASSSASTSRIVTIGRRADNDIVRPRGDGERPARARSSGRTRRWIVEDMGSTNGTYVDHTYERRKSVNLMHGGEVQLGELRFKLVSFAQGQREPQARARLPRQARRADGPAHARPAAPRARRGGRRSPTGSRRR